MPDAVRLDKWLWAVRFFKTRTLAAQACHGGHVRVNGLPAKAARDVRSGDLVTVRTAGEITHTVRVRAVLQNRIGAPLVADYLEDLTPPEELERQRAARRQGTIGRPAGSGRPTKRDRRLLDAWLELPPS